MTSVPCPICRFMSAVVPTATMRSPRMAMACASAGFASTVTTLPLTSTSVAGCAAGCCTDRAAIVVSAAIVRIRTRAIESFLVIREEPLKVGAEYLGAIGFARAGLAQRRDLRVVHRLLPSTGIERRIRTEQQAVGTGGRKRLAEHRVERQPGMVLHPAVRARRVEVHVGRLI